MGQKSNPIGLRLAVNKDWASKWYADKKTFASYLAEDRAIRKLFQLDNDPTGKPVARRDDEI